MENLVTTAIPAGMYGIDRLYEGDHIWTASELIAKMNGGVHMINHLGHSNENYNMKLGNGDVDGLSNDKLFFVYTQGCYSGAFDMGDCIAEHFTVKTSDAAFAGVWNARYGWYSPGATNGLSQQFHRAFVKGLLMENKGTLGKTNHYSKEKFVSSINQNGIRWCYYQTNLFGDPSVVFHLASPTTSNVEGAGQLSWADVKPGTTVTGSFTLSNVGEAASKLAWRVSEYPDWGTWSFTPASGDSLTPEQGILTVQVSVVAPAERNQQFSGTIKVINIQNSSDFCLIPISLATPVSTEVSHPLLHLILEKLLQRFPLLEKILTLMLS
jgi:hypothetical protein